MAVLSRIALALVVIGAINWGLIGLFQYDLVAALFGGQAAPISRVVYTLVGIGGLLCLRQLFSPMEEDGTSRMDTSPTGDVSYSTEFGEETNFTEDDR